MLTYQQARALLDAKKNNIEYGVALPWKKVCRIFWAETPEPGQKGKGDIEVYYFGRYSGKGSPSEKRQRADKAHAAAIASGRGNQGYKICRIQPNGNYYLHGSFFYQWQGIGVLPEDVEWRSLIVTPEAGPPPKLEPVEDIEYPFWVPEEFDPVVTWNDDFSEENHARRREVYEVNIKRFGSMEAWYAAYHAKCQTEETNTARLHEWRGEVEKIIHRGKRRYRHLVERDPNKVSVLYPGAVITPLGQVTKASWQDEKTRIRKQRLAQEKAQREAIAAEKRRTDEFRKKLGSGDAKKIFDALSPELQKFISYHNLTVNPDATVRMVKVVDADLMSFNGQPKVKYEIGTKVEDPNYNPLNGHRHGCGGGLHFSPTKKQCYHYFGFRHTTDEQPGDRSLVVHVDLATMHAIYNDKVTAQWCYVVCEGDETTDLSKQADDKPVRPAASSK